MRAVLINRLLKFNSVSWLRLSDHGQPALGNPQPCCLVINRFGAFGLLLSIRSIPAVFVVAIHDPTIKRWRR